MNIYHNILNLPDPNDYNVNLDGNKTATFTAVYDSNTKQQITNTVKFNGTTNATINIPLQDDVTIHIAGTSASQTGGTATIRGGQSFYFTAPCVNSLEDYQSGNICGSGCERFTALAIKTGGGNTQAQGSWTMDPDGSILGIRISWLDFGSIEITKTNTNADLIDGAIFNLKSVSLKDITKILLLVMVN